MAELLWKLAEPVGLPLLVFLSRCWDYDICLTWPPSSIKRENDDYRWCIAPIHTVNLKDILDVNKINMSLFAHHKMNFLNTPEKNIRRFEQSWSRRKKMRRNVHLIGWSYMPPWLVRPGLPHNLTRTCAMWAIAHHEMTPSSSSCLFFFLPIPPESSPFLLPSWCPSPSPLPPRASISADLPPPS
jgi:hypothetical protein